jgi:hypothetical protein
MRGVRTSKKRADSGEPALSWGCLLRRSDCSDGLQAKGNDLGTDHFARDDQLDAAVLLTSFGGIVGRDGPGLAEARRGGGSPRDALLG